MSLPKTGMQVLFLSIIVLGVYYSCLFSPVTPLDDRALIQWLLDNQNIGLRELFMGSGGSYYRPVLQLSYVLDMKLWGASPVSMHLGNVLLHIANALLIFFCSRIVLRAQAVDAGWAPLVAALLFALHPINTEPVNWIAGRSDLLAGTFVLVSLYLLLMGLSRWDLKFIYYSLLPLGFGVLSKETAVFFMPAAIVLIYSYPVDHEERLASRLRRVSTFFVPYVALPFLYLIFRFLFYAFWKNDHYLGLRHLFSNIHGFMDTLYEVFKVLGFYFKKIIFPWPLNFSIFSFSDIYLWVGIIVGLVVVYLMARVDLTNAFFFSALCLVLSALAAAVLRPAWTPVAERYLYLPSAFFSIGIVSLFCNDLFRTIRQDIIKVLIATIFIVFITSTAYRNYLWLDNIRLFEDSVAKSPEFPFVRSILAELLIEAGRVEEGQEMILNNTAPEGLRNASFLEIKRAQVYFDRGDLPLARDHIIKSRVKGDNLYYLFQKLLVKVDIAMLRGGGDFDRDMVFAELAETYLELQEVYKDPFYYYLLGRLYMQFGNDHNSAIRYFELAAEKAPVGSHYKDAARKLAINLSRE